MLANDSGKATKIVNQLLGDAIRKRASDIHIEPQADCLTVRFRIDGLLVAHQSLASNQSPAIISRLKILSGMDIGQQRLPQDGRLQIKEAQGQSPHEFRVSSCPTLKGEKLVLRHMAPLTSLPALNELGMSQSQLAHLECAITHPWGLILVTGPTGSGKTVTLYASLRALDNLSLNISTIEDPIEMTLPGVNQVGCNQTIGLGFPEALRAFLRQDPDVLMVGEIRDQVTAHMAVSAAQTGHLVFSTLHTNTAAATLTRLKHLKIAPHDLSDCLRLIVAQSLMRRLHACKIPDESAYAQRLAKRHETPIVFRAKGCPICRSGYLGRVGVFETVAITEKMREDIARGKVRPMPPQHKTDAHIHNLQQAAIAHVLAGKTSLAEHNRVISRLHSHAYT